jgi:TatD DNase family protein
MQLIDSHCHLDRLDLDALGGDLEHVFATASELDVRQMLCVAINLELWPNMMKIVEHHDHVYASVGVHPNENEGEDPRVERLVELAAHPKVIAIGETGLDYFRSEGDLEWQRDRFRRHIQAAKQTGKPLIIHSRDAQPDTLNVMAEEGADEVGGIMHCFVDDWETAQRAMEMNFVISFSGIVTFKTATELKEVARRCPLDRMLVETDSPYLTPVPYRGKSNQPGYTRYVAEHIAELKGISVEEVASATTENFYRLFPGCQV